MDSVQIPVRRPDLSFEHEIPRFYMGGNPVQTHFFNALNLAFPDGERFFVKSVHDHIDVIDDPRLLADIRAFSGQEGQHARQHERFFEVLERHGYDVQRMLRPFKKLVRWANRYLPRGLRLSMTAGAEHYTATMAALVLDGEMLEDCDPVVRAMIEWHAIEEIEHKHVAYDVMCAAHPHNYPLRIAGFLIASGVIAGFSLIGLRHLLRQDGGARRIDRAGYEEARNSLAHGKQGRFRRALRAKLLTYFRPGFHPNEQDDAALLAHYRPLVDAAIAS